MKTEKETTPREKAQDQDSAGGLFSSPDECLAAISEYDAPFREAVRQKSRFDDIPMNLKEDISRLVEYCSPDIDYDIEEVPYVSERIPGCKYRLNILSTAEDISAQVDTFYSQAKTVLTDPLLKKGVTPNFALDLLVDRYSQEAGVDDKDEIARIVSRMIQRLFSDGVDGVNCMESAQDVEAISLKDMLAEMKTMQTDIKDLTDHVKAIRKSFCNCVAAKCRAMDMPRADMVSRLARWISAPNVEVSMKEEYPEPYIDYKLRSFIIPFPKVSFSIKLLKEEVTEKLIPFLNIIEHFSKNPILKTSISALKSDIEDIIRLPDQDISISLKRVIERNFRARLIEVSSEKDKYATPEYFDVSRANLDRVITTRPAVVGTNGCVLIKGLYLVPLDNSKRSDNKTIF